jgi:predicted AlkP superfamily pyrophosphatase or phosphodiesterase
MAVRLIPWLLLLGLFANLAAAEPRKDRCVILISVDGLAGFYLDDPRADLPTIRGLAAAGARAEGLVCSFPTVTWPNHTTLVTGVTPARHGVLGNNYLDRASGEKIPLIIDPLFDKDQIVRRPTVYDVAHAEGLTTAGIVWPATRNARTLDFQVPDMAGDNWNKYGTAGWLEELRREGIPVDKHGEWCQEPAGGVQRDWLYTRMARHLFEHHPPNLLLIHLIEVDHVQHKHGPRSPEAYWSVSYADDRVRDIVEAAEASPFAGKITYIVASDHGFFPIEKDIRINVRLVQLGLATIEGTNVTSRAAWSVSQGGGCMVYVLDDARRPELLAQLQRELAAVEGVAEVVSEERFAEIGLSRPEEDPRSPELWLSAQSGYSFTDAHTGDQMVVPRDSRAGTHGYLPDQPDMHGTLVISGAGIARGVKLGKVASIDVAPTMARLLGVELPDTDGRVLTDVLAP